MITYSRRQWMTVLVNLLNSCRSRWPVAFKVYAGRTRSISAASQRPLEDLYLTADLTKFGRVAPLLATVHPFTTMRCESDFEGDLADPSGRYREGRV